MKHFFQRNGLVIALTATVLWFTGLNLCAFGVLAGNGAKGCPICHHNEAGTKSGSSYCDKYNSQEAAMFSLQGAISLLAAALPVIDFLSLDDIRVVQPRFIAGLMATDPPGEQSFAELVLQKSLFTQAPPLC